jgi:processed acidic surface protein
MGHHVLKKGAIIASLGLALSVFSPVASTGVEAATSSESAQKLVDSLQALNLDQVDYLYTYLQSVDLSDKEYKSIIKNAEEAAKTLQKVSSPEELSDGQRAKIARLFLDSAQKAHLQVAFVDGSGNTIDLKNLTLENAKTLNIQIKDLKGNVLATIDPTIKDFEASALNAKLAALKTAVEAKKELEAAEAFVPMPSAKLPNTASNLPTGIAVGSLLVLLGGLTLVPSIRAVRRMENEA